jgi:hypothetical protein
VRRRLADHITRGGLGYCVMGLIVLCGAAWSFGALVEIGNIATERARLTTLPPPYAGYLFAGSVDLFIFYGYLKCYGPPWQIVLAVFHILAGLVTSVWLQYQHSKGTVDPVLVSVIPPLAVAVSLDTWVVSQMVDWYQRSRIKPPWEVPADPQPASVPAPADPPSGPEHPPVQTRPRAAQAGTQPAALGRPTWQPTDDPRIATLLDEGLTPNAVRNQLGLTDKQYRKVSDWNKQRTQLVPSTNGDHP